MSWVIVLLVGFAVGYWMGREAAATVDKRRQKILALFDGKEEITNDDVQRALRVSDATATRALDRLQKSGDVRQVGQTGAGVVYRKR